MAFASFVAVVLITSLPVRADVFWNVAPPNSGDWSVATNWTGGLPASSVNAWIVNGGTATITTMADTCGTLSLGVSGSGTVQMTGGSLTATTVEYVGGSGTGLFVQSGGNNVSEEQQPLFGVWQRQRHLQPRRDRPSTVIGPEQVRRRQPRQRDLYPVRGDENNIASNYGTSLYLGYGKGGNGTYSLGTANCWHPSNT